MVTNVTDEDKIEVRVSIPSELLRDIDAYAVSEGYDNPSAVVSEAIALELQSSTV